MALVRYEGPDGSKHIREFNNEQFGITKETEINYTALISHFQKSTFEWPRLQEIKQILDSGILYSALILALTIPDICARITYPSMPEKNGHRYAKWFDDMIDKYNLGEMGPGKNRFDCFNGYMCYLLRCHMIHGETTNIEDIPNREKSSMKQDGYDYIHFEFTNNPFSEVFIFKGTKKIAFFCKSIYQLVMQIISCADACYQKEPDKSKFADACRIQNPIKMVDIQI